MSVICQRKLNIFNHFPTLIIDLLLQMKSCSNYTAWMVPILFDYIPLELEVWKWYEIDKLFHVSGVTPLLITLSLSSYNCINDINDTRSMSGAVMKALDCHQTAIIVGCIWLCLNWNIPSVQKYSSDVVMSCQKSDWCDFINYDK